MATSLQSKLLNQASLCLEELGMVGVMVNQKELRITFRNVDHTFTGRIDLQPGQSRSVTQKLFFINTETKAIRFMQETTFFNLIEWKQSWSIPV